MQTAAATTLDEWNEKFSDLDTLQRTGRFEFEYEVNYQVAVKSAQLMQSAKGSRQIELTLSILSGDDVVGTCKEWVQLPKQPDDANKDVALVRKLTLIRRDTIGKLLAAADPDTYALGNVSGSARDERALEINRAVMARVDEMHREIEDVGQSALSELEDATLYFHKIENKNKPQYPYTNWSTAPAKKFPTFGATGAG